MKSKVFKISKLNNNPIATQYDFSEKLYGKLHYHDEVQITFIKKGQGLLLSESSTTPFKSNDLIILGANIPHVFVGDKGVLTESISIYFNEEWLYNVYPNNNFLEHFIKTTQKGIKVDNWSNYVVIENILNKSGLYKLKYFFDFLIEFSEIKLSKTFIHKNPFSFVKKNTDSKKINDVFEFLAHHFQTKITLARLAEITHLTPPSFSRYFKQKTGKNISNYIMELRIEKACKLLLNEELTVESVGYSVGYNNFSNFLRQFKKIKKMTPKEFRNINLKPLII